MKAFVRRHKRKIIVGHGIGIIVLVLSGLLTLGEHARVTLFLMPRSDTTVHTDQTVVVDVNMHAENAVNAVGTTVLIPPEYFDIVSIDKTSSAIELWTEERVDRERGEVRVSGGTPQRAGLQGSVSLLSLSLRPKKAGTAELSLKDVQSFAPDGSGVPLESTARSLTYLIIEKPGSTQGSGSTPPPPHAPNPDLNGDGMVTLIDLSILTIKLIGSYDPIYDLDHDGSVGFSDLSTLVSKM